MLKDETGRILSYHSREGVYKIIKIAQDEIVYGIHEIPEDLLKTLTLALMHYAEIAHKLETKKLFKGEIE